MRICVTTCDSITHVGGVEWSILRISKMLTELGWEVDIVQLDLEEIAGELSTEIPGIDCIDTENPALKVWKIRQLYSNRHGYKQLASSLDRLNRMRKYDIFHSFYISSAGFITTMVAKNLGKPVIVSIRGSDIHRDIYSGEQLTRIQWTLENANILTFTNHTLLDIADSIRPCRDRSRVIFNSTGDEYFAKVPYKVPSRPEGFLLGSAGVLSYKKNWRELLHIWEQLRNREILVSLWWIGELAPDEAGEILGFIEDHQLRDSIYISDSLPHDAMVSYLSQLDIYFSTSLDEGCPNSILEAMLSSIPTVAYGAGGVTELVRHNVDGLVFAPCETNLMIDALQKLLVDRDLAMTMGRNARKRALETFSPELERSLWNNCYQDIIDRLP